MRAHSQQIARGAEGLQHKFRALRELVDQAKADPVFRQRSIDVVRHVRERDVGGEVRAVSAYARRLRYQSDPAGVELFTDPRILMAQIEGWRPGTAAGDCDDYVGLAAAMLESLGRPTRFVVGGDERGDGGRHIWLEVRSPRGWIPIDDTVRSMAPGWSPEPSFADITRERVAAGAAPAYRPAMPTTAQRRCYGGAGALQGMAYAPRDGLSGFSLKKTLQKITRPVEKAVSRITPTPIKKAVGAIAKPLIQKPWQALYKAGSKVVELDKRLVMPFASTAANIAVPGSGIVVDTLQRTFAPGQAGGDVRYTANPEPLPADTPPSLPMMAPQFMSSGGGRGFLNIGDDDKGTAVVVVSLVAAGVLALVLLRKRRR